MTSNDVAPAKKRALPRWAAVAVGIAVLVAGGAKLAGALSLPACDSSTATQLVKDIFKEQTGELVEVSAPTLVSEGSSERNCSARIASAAEAAEITYRVYWDGWSKMVQIGEVNAQPIPTAPAPEG